MKKILLESSNRVLVEVSPSDRYWGVGWRKSDPQVRDRNQWLGQNAMGAAWGHSLPFSPIFCRRNCTTVETKPPRWRAGAKRKRKRHEKRKKAAKLWAHFLTAWRVKYEKVQQLMVLLLMHVREKMMDQQKNLKGTEECEKDKWIENVREPNYATLNVFLWNKFLSENRLFTCNKQTK